MDTPHDSRDGRVSQDIHSASRSVARVEEIIGGWAWDAREDGAEKHAALYGTVADALADAVSALDRAAVLLDPNETDIETWEPEA